MEPITVTTTAAHGTAVTTQSELHHLCPYRSERDDGTIAITWETRGRTIELHSLAAYLKQHTERKVSHEDLTTVIANDLRSLQGIRIVAIRTQWETAGMKIDVALPAG